MYLQKKHNILPYYVSNSLLSFAFYKVKEKTLQAYHNVFDSLKKE